MYSVASLEPLDSDSDSPKLVFVAALRYAFSLLPPSPPFGDEIPTSAREQVEYMLDQDDDIPLLTSDPLLKSEVRRGLSHIFSLFRTHLSQLLLLPHDNSILHSLITIQWLCNVLPKMNFMRDFVFNWADISPTILTVFQHQNLGSAIWSLKLSLIEVTSKVFEAVSYGTVIVPPSTKLHLLNTWLPYIQKTKPIFDSFAHLNRMDEDLCQTIQGAVVSMIVTLPSNDQAHILAAWMESHHLGLGYPDLTEAFEIWCYRTKSSKRRLVGRLDGVSSTSLSSDLSA